MEQRYVHVGKHGTTVAIFVLERAIAGREIEESLSVRSGSPRISTPTGWLLLLLLSLLLSSGAGADAGADAGDSAGAGSGVGAAAELVLLSCVFGGGGGKVDG